MKYTTLLITVVLILFSCKKIKETKYKNETQVEIQTTKGKILVALYNETPKHRDNFIKLVNDGFYDSILWHRVINNFIIQTGDPESYNAKPGKRLGGKGVNYLVPSEINENIFHKRGTLSAAHDGNPDLYSSGSHFVITQMGPVADSTLVKDEKWINERLAVYQVFHADSNKVLLESAKKAYNSKEYALYKKLTDSVKNIVSKSKIPEIFSFPQEHVAYYKKFGGVPFNDMIYTVFGEVVEGMDVVDSIATSKTDEYDRPLTDVRIISMKIIE